MLNYQRVIMLDYHQIHISAANKCVISSILLAGYLTVFVSNIVQIRLCHHLAVYITVFTAHIYTVSIHMYTYVYICIHYITIIITKYMIHNLKLDCVYM